MKIGVMTIHNIKNYGSLLQAYAAVTILTRLRHVVEVIDFSMTPKNMSIVGKLLWGGNRVALWIFGIHHQVKVADAEFKSFMVKNIPLSPCFAGKQALTKLSKTYDCVVAGSDQIWHPRCIDTDLSFLLNFVSPPLKKISFSSSFGVKNLSEKQSKIYARELKTFDAISVREKSAQELVRILTGRNAFVILDPTLLLSGDEWRKLASTACESIPYILIYGSMSNKGSIMEKVALRIQKRTGWRILRIHGKAYHVFSRKVKYLFNVGPCDFLSLFQNASLVLANSFHGTAFAINFNRPFFSFYPKEGDLGVRQKHILELLHLKRQAVELPLKNITESDAWELSVDYSQANQMLNKCRMDSIRWLNDALS